MKFRKKPVVIEAYQLETPSDETRRLPPKWFVEAIINGVIQGDVTGSCEIKTLEGVHRGDVGDWIIQGVKGELYPCKPDIFAATYDAVE